MPVLETNAGPVKIPAQNAIDDVYGERMAILSDCRADDQLYQATVNAVHLTGRPELAIAPIIYNVAHIATYACTDPFFFELELPSEAIMRADSAAYVVGQAVRTAVQDNRFNKAYRRNRILQTLFNEDPGLESSLADQDYLTGHCQGPFYETVRLAGGASLALANAGIPQDLHADIIGRSRKLLLAAQIRKQRQRKVFNYLGNPYADPRNLSIEEQDGQVRVGFTERTERVLRKYISSDSGCPAPEIHLGRGRHSINLLMVTFSEITDYILSQGVQVTR